MEPSDAWFTMYGEQPQIMAAPASINALSIWTHRLAGYGAAPARAIGNFILRLSGALVSRCDMPRWSPDLPSGTIFTPARSWLRCAALMRSGSQKCSSRPASRPSSYYLIGWCLPQHCPGESSPATGLATWEAWACAPGRATCRAAPGRQPVRGELPRDNYCALPGIGRYTAGIASIALAWMSRPWMASAGYWLVF
jgi:hypothetical protein